MTVVQIHKVNKIKGRPYTLFLSGYIGHSKFYADLEGTSLVINSSHPLSDKQVSTLEEILGSTFPMPSGRPFKQSDIDRALEEKELPLRISL